jgi:hypothetical protein
MPKKTDVVSEPVSPKLHLDAYESRFILVPESVRAAMFAKYGKDMNTREEWEQMIKSELNRRIT